MTEKEYSRTVLDEDADIDESGESDSSESEDAAFLQVTLCD